MGARESAGFRISPTEVEDVLMATGKLLNAAVIGVPDPVVGERVHALIAPAPGETVNAAELLQRCARELPAHMVPREIEEVSELPRSPNGKVDYALLRAQRVAVRTLPGTLADTRFVVEPGRFLVIPRGPTSRGSNA